MKVKINDVIYDSNDQPVMVVLTDKDKDNITNMHKDNAKYCVYPDSTPEEAVTTFMDTQAVPPQDKTLYKDDFLSLKQLDDWYTYAHMSRTLPAEDSSGQGVAILVYRDSGAEGIATEILGRYETCIVHKSEADGLTSITGGVDKDATVKASALNELYEEAGYENVNSSDLIELGTVRISKQEDSLWHLFAYNATGKDRRADSIGDGSKGEESSYCEWVSLHQGIGCKCPLVSTMVVRAGLLGKES